MVKKIELKVVFNIYNNEMEVSEVPNIIVESMDRAGYAIESAEVVSEDLVSDVCDDDQIYEKCVETLWCYKEDFALKLQDYLEEHKGLEESCKKICAVYEVPWDLRLGKNAPEGQTVEEAMVMAENWWHMSTCLQEAQDEEAEGLGLSNPELGRRLDDVAFYLMQMSRAELARTRLNIKEGKVICIDSALTTNNYSGLF